MTKIDIKELEFITELKDNYDELTELINKLEHDYINNNYELIRKDAEAIISNINYSVAIALESYNIRPELHDDIEKFLRSSKDMIEWLKVLCD